MRTWQIEYYSPYPNIRIRFTVEAKTYEEARIKAEEVKDKMYMTTCYANS
jgi:hypothetical protein